MRLRDAIKGVLNETVETDDDLEEAVTVGGGATGASMVPDPQTKEADVAPGRKKAPGMPGQKLTTDGVTSVEDTDEQNNTNPQGDAAGNLASIKTKMGEHFDAMFDGEDLSEAFKEKASTIFETAINYKIAEITEQLEAHYEEKLNEQVEAIEEQIVSEMQDLTVKLDQYLNYVIEQWMEENQIAIETSLRSEITEDFIAGLKNLFNEHYIEIPEDKVDVVEQLAMRVEELEGRLNDTINENIELKNSLDEMASEEVFNEISEGLTVSQVEKLKKLAEGVDFDNVDNFKKKLSIVKENYFPSMVQRKTSGLLEEAFEGDEATPVATGEMSAYVKAISRTITR